jgi:hypothetical protein
MSDLILFFFIMSIPGIDGLKRITIFHYRRYVCIGHYVFVFSYPDSVIITHLTISRGS